MPFTTLQVLPSRLRMGDRFTDADGVWWQITTQPQARRGGKNFVACVERRFGQPATARVMVWAAGEYVTIRR